MTSIAKSAPRERLLRAAAELFYRDGVAAVGVERLCQTAGISKKSMYQLFATKDDVVAESLRAFGAGEVARYTAVQEADLTPRARILHTFERLEERAGGPGFLGCPFVNTAIEMRDPAHPGSVVAREFKQRLTTFFEEQAHLGGATDPATLAAQLTVVFDGSAVRAVMQARGLDGIALRTATALLDAAGIP